MNDEIWMWVLVAMSYAGGYWHGWVTGGTHVLKQCTGEIHRRWKELEEAS